MPMQPVPKTLVLDWLWLFALAIGLPLLAMLLLGTDANWDLRNYHLYNPHAWLTGRDAIDIAPAQLQSWHNPLLDVPMYLLVSSGADARWTSLWLTLPSMLSLFLLLRLQTALSPVRPSRTSQSVLVLLAITGAAFGSTLGLSMNDAFVGAAIMGSLVVLVEPREDWVGRHRWLLAGLIAGAITGLKLTAIFYCLGLAVASLATGPWPRQLGRMAALGMGGTLGFLLTYGAWGWRMFVVHGNPFFPYYNNLFQSPDALAWSWTDTRFRTESVFETLASPFELLTRTRDFSEPTLRDPRLLLGVAGLAALWLWHRRATVESRGRYRLVLVFFVVSWLLWAMQYGIYRYAIVLEMLGCLALVLVLQRLPRARHLALVVALLVVVAGTKRPNWGHVRSTAPVAGIVAPLLPADSLVVVASQEPLAYLALGLPRDVPMIAVLNNFMAPGRCTGLQAQARSRIAAHAGPVWLLAADAADAGKAQALAGGYLGLDSGGACREWRSAIGSALLCPQRQVRAPEAGC